MKHKLVKILMGAFVGCFLLGGLAFAAEVSLPPVSVPTFSYYYDASGVSAPTVIEPGRYSMGTIVIDAAGPAELGPMNNTPPWILRCYTDNPIGPATGRGGFVRDDGASAMTCKIWCANFGPVGYTDLMTPPDMSDEYWRGTDTDDPVWLRLFDLNDGLVYWAPSGAWWPTGVPAIDRLICAVDPTVGLAWVTDENPEGDATLPTPFAIGIAIEPTAITAPGTYICNLVLETAEL